MPFLELFAYLDHKAAQSLQKAGDHAGLASHRLPYQSMMLCLSQEITLMGLGQFVQDNWVHGYLCLLWRFA